MSVSNGQRVSAEVTNAAFLSRTTDTSTIGKLDVNNTTQSTSAITGALHTQGGLGVEKNLNVGENAAITGTLGVTGATTLTTVTSGNITSSGTIQGQDLIATQSITAATSMTSGSVVTGTASVGTITSTGLATFESLQVTNDSDLNTLSTAGLATLQSLQVTNNSNLLGDLDVTGDTDLATMSTTGLATLESLQVTNDANIGGDVIITGDLTVNGTTTTVNSTTVTTVDPNITLNQGGNDASAEGSGLTIDRTGTDGSLIYKAASATKWAAGNVGTEVDLVGTSSTQTLTNKTLSGNEASNFTNSGATITLPTSTSNLATLALTETLTNKTINGSNNTITNVSLTTGVTGTLPIANGGTGQTTQTNAFDALAPTTTKGDLIAHNGTDNVRLGVGTNGQYLVADSAEATGLKWLTVAGGSTSYDSSLAIQNLGISASVGSNALTINITQKDGTTPSTGSAAVKVGVRSATLTSGQYNLREVTTALSMTISSGSNLGHTSGGVHDIYVYLIDNAGTLELAVSHVLFNDSLLVSTTAEGGAGAADANNVMYSTTARTSVPFRVVGKLISTQTTAGTWAAVPTNIILGDYGKLAPLENIYAEYNTAAGQSIPSGTETIINFGTRIKDTKGFVGTGSFGVTVPVDGDYQVSTSAILSSASWAVGNTIYYLLTKNGTFVKNIMYYPIPASHTDFSHAVAGTVNVPCVAGDVLRVIIHQNRGGAVSLLASANYNYISIQKVG